jgi:hypothetical protein
VTLEPSTLQHLAEFVRATGLPIEDMDDLERLLETVNAATEPDPAKRASYTQRFKEELASQERQKERELAQAEKLRQFEHAEKMRAYALGREDPAALVARAKAARRIGSFVPLIALAAATVTTWKVVTEPSLADYPHYSVKLSILAVAWGVCGAVSVLAVVAGLILLHSRRTPKPPADAFPADKDLPATSTAIVSRLE